MNTRHLVHMANQIGTYFAADPDHALARAGIAEHLARFWEKRMRQNLYAGLEQPETEDLAPLVREALLEHRARILGKSA